MQEQYISCKSLHTFTYIRTHLAHELRIRLLLDPNQRICRSHFCSKTGKYLSDIEMKVLQGSWEGKSYEEIAKTYGYSAEYLNKDVGNKLWHKLSEALGEKITKKNFKEALRRFSSPDLRQYTNTNLPSHTLNATANLQFPEGSVSLDSPFYVERCNIESLCCETVLKPGSLIRIKAPEMMGKTSLMTRILAQGVFGKTITQFISI